MSPEDPSLAKIRVNPRLYKYGIGGGGGFTNNVSGEIEKYEFKWDPELSEEENVYRLDLQATRCLFEQSKMTFDLKKG